MRSRGSRQQGEESDTTSVSACSQSSHSFQPIPQHIPTAKVPSTSSSTSSKPLMPNSENRTIESQQQSQQSYQAQQQQILQKMKVEQQQQQQQQQQQHQPQQPPPSQHCPDFLEATHYTTVPMETVIAGTYSGSLDTSMITPLQPTEVRKVAHVRICF